MVDPSADADILAVVHRRLAQRYHPDMDPGDDARQRMLEINQAYDVLRNAERRAKYDQELSIASRPAEQRPVREATHRPGARWHRDDQQQHSRSPMARRGPRRGVSRAARVLDFGRYKGWSLGQIAAHDPDFLEWLERSPAGRQYRAEIMALLNRR